MKWASDANSATRLIISRLGLPSHKKEEGVVKRAYEDIEFCAQVYRKLVKSLDQRQTHYNLYRTRF